MTGSVTKIQLRFVLQPPDCFAEPVIRGSVARDEGTLKKNRL